MSATLVLRAELDDDPLGRGYSSMSDDQLIASINEPNRPAPLRPIPSAELLGWSSAGANTAGAAVAGAAAERVLGDEWIGFFAAFFTFAILMFSEVIPKTSGVVYNRALSLVVARPLNLLVLLFTPLIWMTGLVTRLISRGKGTAEVSQDELVVMARLGLKSGAIDADHAEVIENVLSLESKTVRDIMTPRTVVFSLGADLSVVEVQDKGKVLNHSRIPVYDKDADDIVGMVLRRDLLTSSLEKGDERVGDLMRPIDFVAQTVTVDRLLRMFLERGQHLLVAIDEFGGLAGLVTLEDVLEAILGVEIVDEFDQVADLRELARRRRQGTLDS